MGGVKHTHVLATGTVTLMVSSLIPLMGIASVQPAKKLSFITTSFHEFTQLPVKAKKEST